jgi:hypothetical protein
VPSRLAGGQVSSRASRDQRTDSEVVGTQLDDEDLDPYALWARHRLEPLPGRLRVIDRKGGPPGLHDLEADLPDGLAAAGQFNIMAVADHDACPDLGVFTAAAQDELQPLATTTQATPSHHRQRWPSQGRRRPSCNTCCHPPVATAQRPRTGTSPVNAACFPVLSHPESPACPVRPDHSRAGTGRYASALSEDRRAPGRGPIRQGGCG